MAFGNAWVETDPDGSVITVSQLDNSDRLIKAAVRERLEGDPASPDLTGLLEVGSFAAAPKPRKGAARVYVDTAANIAAFGVTKREDGRLAIASDTGRLYHVATAAVAEIAYLPLAGGTVTGALTASSTATFSHATGVTTNTITERTAASGVTIDGTLIKDAGLTATGVCTFSNAAGVTTNTVTERTAASGVTVDGVLLKDAGATITGTLALAGATVSGQPTWSSSQTLPGITVTAVATFSDATGVTTNTITERTAAAGVTVDGVLLKDAGATITGTLALAGATVSGQPTWSSSQTLPGITVTGAATFSDATGITTDTITERTAAAGVTVDGTLIKDGGATLTGALSVAGVATFSDATGVTTNVVTERTAGSGVTADGVLLKDSGITLAGITNLTHSTNTDTGAQNDWNPTLAPVIRWNGGANMNLNAIRKPTGSAYFYLVNVTAVRQIIIDQDSGVGGVAAQIIFNGDDPVTLLPDGVALFWYDTVSIAWRLMMFEQALT